MAVELKIPEVGESITEVQISEWLKSEGDEVKEDENVAVIDSEKTTFELPSPKGGRLVKILHKAGDTVKIGEAIAELDTNGKTEEKPTSPQKQKEQKTQPETEAVTESQSEQQTEEDAGTKEKVPEQERKTGETQEIKPKAKENPEPTEDKKETKESRPEPPETTDEKPVQTTDSEPAKAADNDREEEVVPMTMLRRTVARRLVDAQRTMAMLTTFNEVDMSAVLALRREHGESFEKRYQVKLGLMSFFVKAAIDSLKQFPKLNAEIRETDIVFRNYFDIGVAIATERGLVVPVLSNAERLSFAEVEKAIGDFAQRAKTGQLKPDELEGGTFTITNGGVFGSLLSTPIINPPQTGILGMHAIQERPVAMEGQVVVRPMMYVALTYDHRLVDGRDAVLFLHLVKEAIENPARMLIEI